MRAYLYCTQPTFNTTTTTLKLNRRLHDYKEPSIYQEATKPYSRRQFLVTMLLSLTLGTIATVGGGVAAVGLTPVIVGTVGFTGAGIAAGSMAAKMMSAAAIANGGGVAAGGLVATLQSVGAAGLGLTGTAVSGAVGSALGMAAAIIL